MYDKKKNSPKHYALFQERILTLTCKEKLKLVQIINTENISHKKQVEIILPITRTT